MSKESCWHRCRYFCRRQTQPRSRPFSTPVKFSTEEKKSKLRAFARVDRLGGRHGRNPPRPRQTLAREPHPQNPQPLFVQTAQDTSLTV